MPKGADEVMAFKIIWIFKGVGFGTVFSYVTISGQRIIFLLPIGWPSQRLYQKGF